MGWSALVALPSSLFAALGNPSPRRGNTLVTMRTPAWRNWLAGVAALVLAAAPAVRAEEPAAKRERYWCLLRDGAVLTAPEVRDWVYQPRLRATIAGRPLFEPSNPVRLLRDTRLRPALRPPYVQFANGDVLPGAVARYVAADPAANAPACVMVTMTDPLRGWGGQTAEVAIRLEQLARVVAARPAGEAGADPLPQPGTVTLADGRRLPIQAVRWGADGLKVLASEGMVSVAFKDLVALDLPKPDAIAALLAETISPAADPASPVGRLVSSQGGVWTFRQAMLMPTGVNVGGQWRMCLFVQPSWALAPIGVPVEALVTLSFRDPAQVPLSLLPAQTLAQRSFTGYLWDWQRNQNVRGGELSTGALFSDLGLGTHSYSEIAFDLPAKAQQFSVTVGLDNGVGTGGCVQCRLHRDTPRGEALWRSDFIRGGEAPVKVGPVSVAGVKRLVLVTDFGHEGRPKGADPGDIRDEVDWLNPLVEVERPGPVRAAEILGAWWPALEGWTLADTATAGLRWSAAWDAAGNQWEPALANDRNELIFTRTLAVTREAPVLEVALPVIGAEHGRVPELTANGKAVPPGAVSWSDNARTLLGAKRGQAVQRWPLDAFIGKDVTLVLKVKLTAKPNEPAPSLVLRGVRMVAEPVRKK